MNKIVNVFLKDLSKEKQRQVLAFDNVSSSIKHNIFPIMTIMPEDVVDYLDENFDTYDDDMYDDDVCDDDCAICERPYCDIRDAIDVGHYDYD